MIPNKERYYLQGDQAEGATTFYCSACDIFFAAEHLGQAGAARYARELKNFERRGQWRKDQFSRPADAVNVFASSLYGKV
jgi:hypothetical protein